MQQGVCNLNFLPNSITIFAIYNNAEQGLFVFPSNLLQERTIPLLLLHPHQCLGILASRVTMGMIGYANQIKCAPVFLKNAKFLLRQIVAIIGITYRHDPAGRDTETIYGYAEADGLIGKGGFWERSKEEIPGILEKEIEKRLG